IYNWIEESEDREHWESLLRRRGKRPSRRKPKETGEGARIADRPEVIDHQPTPRMFSSESCKTSGAGLTQSWHNLLSWLASASLPA
ncbi:MAG TPA: hypothetical protein VJ783_20015, partial [Pirellulales bacterium]|nr:hypothetical protein [Pirellulales bacterium]